MPKVPAEILSLWSKIFFRSTFDEKSIKAEFQFISSEIRIPLLFKVLDLIKSFRNIFEFRREYK